MLESKSGAAFRAIADPTRREILDLLRDSGPQRAGDIAVRFPDVTRIAISKHLRVLREAELIQPVETDDARERRYTLNAAGFAAVHDWLQHYDTFWRQRLSILKQISEDPPV
jgi:DNA-binding transcriptional ArsR family regulator